MKRFLAWFFILFGLTILVVSTSKKAMQKIFDWRDKDVWWGRYQGNHGDLASMSHLDFFDKFYDPKTYYLRKANYEGEKNTVLFLHGDSYIWKLGDSIFAGVCDYKFIGWNGNFKYHLDAARKNILVIETSERLLREYYGTTRIIDEMTDIGMAPAPHSSASHADPVSVKYCSLLPDIGLDCFFNKYINEYLNCNLLDYNFMMPLPGSKAGLSYYLFHRASGDVVISKDRQFLLFKKTIDPSTSGSSFAPVSDTEVTKLVGNFNRIYDYYKASGFKEVYLSIIPNTVTIVEPEGYNNLIPRVQNDSRLRIKVIDIYSVFKNAKQNYFQRGDTHWNIEGKQKWIDMVNEKLLL